MSAPSVYPPGGSPDELRGTIGELMAAVEMRAGIIQTYAQLGDDAGLAYGLRCVTAELKAALSAAGMLAEITKPERERCRATRPARPEQHEARP